MEGQISPRSCGVNVCYGVGVCTLPRIPERLDTRGLGHFLANGCGCCGGGGIDSSHPFDFFPFPVSEVSQCHD